MKITFACPGCGCSGSVDGSLAGRQIRCNQCNNRFPVPHPNEAEDVDDGYALQEPSRASVGIATTQASSGATFVPARSREPNVALSPRKPRRTKARKKSRDDGPEIAWHKWLIGAGIAFVVGLVLVALILPNGVEIAGTTLVLVGGLMTLVGWSAGLYGAWCEDFLYAFLYFFIPLYSAYYLVTRWDDLWRWFACSTAGVGLVMIGSQVLRSAGFGEVSGLRNAGNHGAESQEATDRGDDLTSDAVRPVAKLEGIEPQSPDLRRRGEARRGPFAFGRLVIIKVDVLPHRERDVEVTQLDEQPSVASPGLRRTHPLLDMNEHRDVLLAPQPEPPGTLPVAVRLPFETQLHQLAFPEPHSPHFFGPSERAFGWMLPESRGRIPLFLERVVDRQVLKCESGCHVVPYSEPVQSTRIAARVPSTTRGTQ